MMTSETTERGPTNILPIPPPLEFPFPQEGHTSSTASSLRNTGLSSVNLDGTPITSRNSTITGSPTRIPTTVNGRNDSGASRPRPAMAQKKFMTERPVPAQRGSLLRMKRRQTGDKQKAMNTVIWNSDSDNSSSSSSSSDDEESRGITKQPSTTSGRSATRARADSTKRPPGEQGLYSKFLVGNDNYQTRGRVSKRDGRLNISIHETAHKGYLAKALGATLPRHLVGDKHPKAEQQPLSPLREEDAVTRPEYLRAGTASTTALSFYDKHPVPKLNIVIMVIGSRGDIQPFLRLGKLLKEEHGHRVRIATHPAFKKFVEQDIGLEFFSVGGDPAEIMAFMVKNPGLIPKAATIKAGEIGRRRDSMYEMFQGFWRACINATDDERDTGNLQMMDDKHPFVADAIIANPPSFAHVHCAERLGIPLHLMFTFPNSPTQQFPHPVTNIKQSNVDVSYTNFMSYPLVEMLIWQGLGDLVNRFRVKSLGLEPVSTLWAPGQLFRQRVPYSYLWSPGLVPKPPDWGPEIDVVGYVFLELASSYKPPESLTQFLEAGEPPVYIGFGSIVVDNADKFTALIFEAVKRAGVRALVSKGWGNLGDEGNTPDNIYMLGDTPHDWLFPRVSAVVHHGGAGSTAAGLKCGKPTLIVPFFADQPFWGAMVAKSGAGSEPIPYKHLTSDKLAAGIKYLLSLEAKGHAEAIAKSIAEEGDGAANAVKSFHRSLPLRGEHSMRCAIMEDRVAVWTLKGTRVRLSALAADILVQKKKIKWHDLRLLRHYEWNDFAGAGEPLTGGGAAILNTTGGIVKGIGGIPVRLAKRISRREQHTKEKKRRRSTHMATKSQENGTLPMMNRHTNGGGDKDTNGKLSGGGQYEVGKNLPKSTAMNGTANINARSSIYASHAVVNGAHPKYDGNEDAESICSVGTGRSEENVAQELVEETGHGLALTGEALVKAPMDLALALAQGFHNAPRLYGDTTVRKPIRISGYKSGLRAAGEEFGYGIYDGWTGLVKHPYHGAKQEGALGFVKGMGKGVGGFVLKDLAAIFGPVGYTMKGIHKELVKDKQPTHFIRQARMIQGQRDLRVLDAGEREEAVKMVCKGWHIIIDIRTDFEEIKHHGIQGRIAFHRERRHWRKHGAFENVEQASKALEAKRDGRDFDEVFERQMWELKKAEGPRKSTMGGKPKKLQTSMAEQAQNKSDRKDDGVLAGGNTGTDVGDKAAIST